MLKPWSLETPGEQGNETEQGKQGFLIQQISTEGTDPTRELLGQGKIGISELSHPQ